MKRSNFTILDQLKGKTTGKTKGEKPNRHSVANKFVSLLNEVNFDDEGYKDEHQDRASKLLA